MEFPVNQSNSIEIGPERRKRCCCLVQVLQDRKRRNWCLMKYHLPVKSFIKIDKNSFRVDEYEWFIFCESSERVTYRYSSPIFCN